MNEQTQSLAAMASMKNPSRIDADAGKTDSAAGNPRFKTGTDSRASREGGFDGFLKTFLGKDGASSSAAASDAARRTRERNAQKANNQKNDSPCPAPRKKSSGKIGSRLGADEKRALRRSLDKTVPADRFADFEALPAFMPYDPAQAPCVGRSPGYGLCAGAGETPGESVGKLAVSPETAAAAKEAAMLIWNLLHGPAGESANGAIPEIPSGVSPGALEKLAGLLASRGAAAGKASAGLSGLSGAPGLGPDGSAVDAEALRAGIGAANVSAEMNSAAILSALDDLLDGMPQEALEQALSDAAAALGLPEAGEGGLFAAVAGALGVEATEISDRRQPAAASALLAMLDQGTGGLEAIAAGPETATADAVAASNGVPGTTGENGAAPEGAGGEEAPEKADEAENAEAAAAAGNAEISGIGAKAAAIAADKAEPAEAATAAKRLAAAGQIAGEDAGDAHGESGNVGIEPESSAGTEEKAVSESEETARVETAGKEGGSVSAGDAATAFDAASAVETAKPNSAAATAESAGPDNPETDIFILVKQFLKEKRTENTARNQGAPENGPADADADALLDEFSAWLAKNGNHREIKEMQANRTGLAQTLHNAFNAAGTAAGDNAAAGDADGENIFPATEKTLESSLHSNAGMKAESAETGQEGLRLEGATILSRFSASAETGTQQPGGAVPGSVAATPAVQPGVPAAAHSAASSSMFEQIENIERLADAMRMANRNGVKNLTLQLSPPELGKVMLRVESRNGVVSAYLRVEKPETAAQLTHGLGQLRENLKAQGIELGELDVRQQQQGQALGDFGGQGRKRNQETDPDADGKNVRHGSRGEEDEGDETIPVRGASRRDAAGGLNFLA